MLGRGHVHDGMEAGMSESMHQSLRPQGLKHSSLHRCEDTGTARTTRRCFQANPLASVFMTARDVASTTCLCTCTCLRPLPSPPVLPPSSPDPPLPCLCPTSLAALLVSTPHPFACLPPLHLPPSSRSARSGTGRQALRAATIFRVRAWSSSVWHCARARGGNHDKGHVERANCAAWPGRQALWQDMLLREDR